MGLELGTYLASVRSVKKQASREVEKATHREVSNAYLSQLETGKTSRPSPNVLNALAKVYGGPYEALMEKAGSISPAAPHSNHRIFQMVWRWCRRRHPNKGRRWIRTTYFPPDGHRHWVFTGMLLNPNGQGRRRSS